MTTFVFPGQGSQYKGMGENLFEEFPEYISIADKVLGYSIRELCIRDPYGNLGKTNFTQPALYVVNSLYYFKHLRENRITPNYIAGHSLGEYNALLAAGGFDFETGLRLVKKRGELMSRANGGGMAAVIGISQDEVENLMKSYGLSSLDIANLNSPSQIVISGLKEDIQNAEAYFDRAGVKSYVQLNVSGAFHSRYMQSCKEAYAAFINEFEFSDLNIPVISNVTARPYRREDIRRLLTEQITSTVKWTESIRYLMGKQEYDIIELGPKNVLTRLVESIHKDSLPLIEEEETMTYANEQYKTGACCSCESDPLESHVEEPIEFKQEIKAASLGDPLFRKDYNLKYAYISGAMFRGVASEEMVIRMGKAGMMGIFGTGGLKPERIEKAILHIKNALSNGEAYGMNLLHNPENPYIEENTVDLFLQHQVTIAEASAYIIMTPALVRYRAKGLARLPDGTVSATNRIIAKVSRPEVAESFLSPAPARIIEKLLREGKITQDEAVMLGKVPVADELCVEADSGGHTDQGVAYALLPSMIRLRDQMMLRHRFGKRIRIGAAGGIGTPEAAAAAFMLGADFVVTGSINQCTVEAGTSEAVKDLLEQANVQDMEYAPAGDMFELGVRVQVLKKGLFFPARANKLYDLYRHYNSLDELDENTKRMLEEKYFNRTFEEVYEEVRAYKPPEEIEKAERIPKYKMLLVFKWYFAYSIRLAMSGDLRQKVNYQIHCGPALGAFNQWVKGTELESWRNRHVNRIGELMMQETAELLNRRISALRG